MEAAVRAFARKGYHACRVGEIAEEAGVAYGLVYHYFGSKEEVLETIFHDTWKQMLARVREVQEEGGPAEEQVRKVTALLLRTWRRDPDLVRCQLPGKVEFMRKHDCLMRSGLALK